MRTLVLINSILLAIQFCAGQTFIVGTVVDAGSGKPLAFASVYYPKQQVSTLSNENGGFRILRILEDSLVFEYLGYVTKTVSTSGISDTITLSEKTYLLSEVEIYSQRLLNASAIVKYKRKHFSNPNLQICSRPKYMIVEPIDAKHRLLKGINLSVESITKDSIRIRVTVQLMRKEGSFSNDSLVPLRSSVVYLQKSMVPSICLILFERPCILPSSGNILLTIEALQDITPLLITTSDFHDGNWHRKFCNSLGLVMEYNKFPSAQYISHPPFDNRIQRAEGLLNATGNLHGLKQNSMGIHLNLASYK